MIWQNETTYKTSNNCNKVTLRFIGRTWLNVIYRKPSDAMPNVKSLTYQIQLSAPPKSRNAQVRYAAEKMCEHLSISLAETIPLAAEIRKFIEQVL